MHDFVGIDVSKDFLDVYCLNARSAWQVRNTPDGQADLALRLAGARRVVVEATGGYQKAIVKALRNNNINVFVANPRRIRRFADGIGTLAKTDALDAQVLAHYAFALEVRPRPQTIPSDAVESLKELITHRQGLVEQRVACQNRQKQLQDPFALQQLNALIQSLEALEKDTQRHIRLWIQQNPSLAERDALLQQMIGVGPVVAPVLLAELSELGQASSQEIAAIVGVAPFDCQSGKWQGQKHIFGGRKNPRTALYHCANVARRYDPEMMAYYNHLRQKGKSFKVALVACMRKMLVRLNARFRDAFYPLPLQSIS